MSRESKLFLFLVALVIFASGYGGSQVVAGTAKAAHPKATRSPWPPRGYGLIHVMIVPTHAFTTRNDPELVMLNQLRGAISNDKRYAAWIKTGGFCDVARCEPDDADIILTLVSNDGKGTCKLESSFLRVPQGDHAPIEVHCGVSGFDLKLLTGAQMTELLGTPTASNRSQTGFVLGTPTLTHKVIVFYEPPGVGSTNPGNTEAQLSVPLALPGQSAPTGAVTAASVTSTPDPPTAYAGASFVETLRASGIDADFALDSSGNPGGAVTQYVATAGATACSTPGVSFLLVYEVRYEWTYATFIGNDRYVVTASANPFRCENGAPVELDDAYQSSFTHVYVANPFKGVGTLAAFSTSPWVGVSKYYVLVPALILQEFEHPQQELNGTIYCAAGELSYYFATQTMDHSFNTDRLCRMPMLRPIEISSILDAPQHHEGEHVYTRGIVVNVHVRTLSNLVNEQPIPFDDYETSFRLCNTVCIDVVARGLTKVTNGEMITVHGIVHPGVPDMWILADDDSL